MPESTHMFYFVGRDGAGQPGVMSANGYGPDPKKAAGRAKPLVESTGFTVDGEAETDLQKAKLRLAELARAQPKVADAKPTPAIALPGEDPAHPKDQAMPRPQA